MIYDTAIIGGGIAGLSAAYFLNKQGRNVALIEKDRLGGLIKSANIDGFTFEEGAGTLSGDPAFVSFLKELGLSDSIAYPDTPYRHYVYSHDAFYEIPSGPFKLLLSSLLSFGDKATFIAGIRKRFPVGHFNNPLTVRDFVSQLFNRNVADRIADPVLRGIFGGDIEQLWANLVFPKVITILNSGYSILDMARGKVKGHSKRGKPFCLRGGNDLLCRSLIDAVGKEVSFFNEIVNDLTIDESSKLYSLVLSGGTRIHTRSVLLATSGPATARYLISFDGACAKDLNKLPYAGIFVVHCAVSKPNRIPLRSFGCLFPTGTANDLLGVLHNSKVYPHIAPEKKDLLTICFGGLNKNNLSQREWFQYLQAVPEILLKIYLVIDHRILSYTYVPYAIPQYTAECDQVNKHQMRIQTLYPGLYFIGADVGGVGVPQRVERAREGVARILKHLNQLESTSGQVIASTG